MDSASIRAIHPRATRGTDRKSGSHTASLDPGGRNPRGVHRKSIPRGLRPPYRTYSATRRNRSALPTTETELRLIAAAAIIGLSSRPKNGYSTPAAIGTLKVL
jgi:hypothetical protein